MVRWVKGHRLGNGWRAMGCSLTLSHTCIWSCICTPHYLQVESLSAALRVISHLTGRQPLAGENRDQGTGRQQHHRRPQPSFPAFALTFAFALTSPSPLPPSPLPPVDSVMAQSAFMPPQPAATTGPGPDTAAAHGAGPGPGPDSGSGSAQGQGQGSRGGGGASFGL